jgi:hypothetical protein
MNAINPMDSSEEVETRVLGGHLETSRGSAAMLYAVHMTKSTKLMFFQSLVVRAVSRMLDNAMLIWTSPT